MQGKRKEGRIKGRKKENTAVKKKKTLEIKIRIHLRGDRQEIIVICKIYNRLIIHAEDGTKW